jgi:CMP/dCMP kinase
VKRVVVAIDGPAGAGKSTVAARLARELGYVLLDTGAIYRAVALAAQRDGIDWEDEAAVGALAHRLADGGDIALEPAPDAAPPNKGIRVLLRGEDVSAAIRAADISMGASRVSAIPAVRVALLDLQRSLGAGGGVVAEGRDIGTVVFPEAEVKFFLTASVSVRAGRRYDELRGRGFDPNVEEVRRDVVQRDRQDSERPVAPLKQADDAVLVDSTGRDVDDIVAEMKNVVASRSA